jgi:hypothetical protein
MPRTLDWDKWLVTAPARPYKARYPEGHPVHNPPPEKHHQSDFKDAGLSPVPPLGVIYHPFVWRGFTEFGSGARGERPPLKVYWYDGGKRPPAEITGTGERQPAPPGAPPGLGGGLRIGTKGSLPQGRGPFLGRKPEPVIMPAIRDWGRASVHKDWVVAVKTGKQPGCHFGYASPFTEAYQLGNVALRVGYRIEWDPLAFRVTNCREANQYLHREYRRGWDIQENRRRCRHNSNFGS